MTSPVTLAERPDYPGLEALDNAVAALADAVASLRAAELSVQERKAALAPAVPKVDDPEIARRLAVYIYWNMPEVPVAPLAEMATGLVGGRAQQAFFKLSGTHSSAVSCGACGKPFAVRSRDEMKRVLTAKLKRAVLPTCETCLSSRRPETPSVYVEHPVSNPVPSAFDREVLSLHADRGQPKVVETLCLWGVQRVELQPEHIRLYLQDPDLGVAAALGVTREDYREWLEGYGSVRCDGVTKDGDRCRNTAKKMTGLELSMWLEARSRGGYCVVHGG